MKPNTRRNQIFLDKLNWKTNSGEMQNITTFQIDVYKFIFKPPLVGSTMTDFTEYLQNLPMAETRSIMKIFIWLYQHEVKFKMKFSYSPRIPFKHNLENIGKPRKLRRLLLSYGHDELMSCPLEMLDQKDNEQEEEQ